MQSLNSHQHLLLLQADEEHFRHEVASVKQEFRLVQVGETQFKHHRIVDLLQVLSRQAHKENYAFVIIGDSTLRLGIKNCFILALEWLCVLTNIL